MKTHAFLFLTGDEVCGMALAFLLTVGLVFWLAEKVWIGLMIRKLGKDDVKKVRAQKHVNPKTPAYRIPSRRKV